MTVMVPPALSYYVTRVYRYRQEFSGVGE